LAIQAVFFDIDGTLVDSNEQHVMAWAYAFREEGQPQELDDIRQQVGKGGDLLVPALLPDVDAATAERIAKRQGEYFKSVYLDQIQPFDGAAELLRQVHASGRKILLASSAKQTELEHYMKLLGVGDIIDATTSIDDVDVSKPAPDIFSAALEKSKVPATDVIVVGDTPYDVEAAAAAGLMTIGVTSGPFDERRLKDAGAISIYPNVAALLAEFDRSALS
jgi:membrane protein